MNKFNSIIVSIVGGILLVGCTEHTSPTQIEAPAVAKAKPMGPRHIKVVDKRDESSRSVLYQTSEHQELLSTSELAPTFLEDLESELNEMKRLADRNITLEVEHLVFLEDTTASHKKTEAVVMTAAYGLSQASGIFGGGSNFVRVGLEGYVEGDIFVRLVVEEPIESGSTAEAVARARKGFADDLAEEMIFAIDKIAEGRELMKVYRTKLNDPKKTDYQKNYYKRKLEKLEKKYGR